MGECKDAPITSPFLLSHDCPATGKPALYLPPLNNYLFTAAPAGDNQVSELFQPNSLTGVSPRPKHYPPITVSIIT